VKVLCLDIEGGFGGSSRSLFESVRVLAASGVEFEIWCRKQGPVMARYAAIGVRCRHEPDMPHVSSLPRLSRNLVAYGRALLRWPASKAFRHRLLERLRTVEVLHLNHEGLFLLARWLAPRTQTPIISHVRTHLPATMAARWQYRTLAGAASRLVFITENERDNVARLIGRPPRGAVVCNIALASETGTAPPRGPKRPGRFKVCVLSNYSYMRGIDRLVDVAAELRARGSDAVEFVIAGDMSLSGKLPAPLGAIARRNGTLSDYVEERGLSEMFRFLGHVETPEAVLAACDILAKPTREANPWGRDILEALAAGKPVFSVGTYDRFVEDGVTGFLRPDFDAADWADAILDLASDLARYEEFRGNAVRRANALCNPEDKAAELLQVWQSVLDGSSSDS
jgi:glycosyltransferase involved in cell wall biosynthesis